MVWSFVQTGPQPRSGSRVMGLVGANNAVTPNTKYDLGADEVVMVDRAKGIAYVATATGTLTCNLGVTGANGLDTGVQAASTWYHFYFIFNPATATVALIASVTAPTTGPALPSGYTAWAYVTTIRSNSNTQLIATYIRGSLVKYSDALNRVLSAGGAVTPTSVDVSAVVPPNALRYDVLMEELDLTSDGAGRITYSFKIELTSGLYLHYFYKDFTGLGISTVQSSGGGPTCVVPNKSQSFLYLWTVITGSAPSAYLDVPGYYVPNGDS